uniref:Reverse transcriptase domain-containing protein n=1 Tax=Nicotiana tabacum TaxID=4097 RepID=A0A1S4CNA8_TOBAC|nr:PREDICTED: uncharacterized protein LOC107820708 [Nicotiana tabacum]
MAYFSDFIEDMKLVDLLLIKGVYTWTCGDNQEISFRIDRVLVSAECRPDYIIACKLKALKGRLKKWSQSNYGNLEMRKNLILHQEKKPGIMCKLDIEKAYDHANWGFLLGILQKMGFGRKLINWMKFCINTVRGLRQGDPLSHFHFILAMKGLNNMLKTAHGNGWINGFNVANIQANKLEITHLQYADDTLIFCDAEKSQLRHLRVTLILFEAISGLHINWRKSQIILVNEIPRIQLLVDILGEEVGTTPTIYLGMPLGAKSKSKDIWNDVLEKCEKKLAR